MSAPNRAPSFVKPRRSAKPPVLARLSKPLRREVYYAAIDAATKAQEPPITLPAKLRRAFCDLMYGSFASTDIAKIAAAEWVRVYIARSKKADSVWPKM